MADNTFLPHWGPIRRGIHRLCLRSRFWNSFVSAVEMRLGRGEALALPQYIVLCLTGRCNAQCGFCSVTVNRTGILKRDMLFERIEGFLKPALRVARMVGLQGNGEPTLYPRFDDALDMAMGGGADAHLITNGARIEREQIPVLLKLETINISLNAATAETHQTIMKLREFDHIVGIIKDILTARGKNSYPRIAVSMVVENGNVHEVQAFLYFAEYELGVDRIYLRPLSELGTNVSIIEDLRGLVPYESDIADMLDAVEDYIKDVPRKAEIVYEPDTFKADRADPINRVLLPRGYEDRLLAPRPRDWLAAGPGVTLTWNLNSLTVAASAGNGPSLLCSSVPIPVSPRRTLSFEAGITVESGSLGITVTDIGGNPLAETTLSANPGQVQRVSLSVETGEHEQVRLVFRREGEGCNAEIDFGRLRTPAPGPRKEFRLPHRHRWEVDSANVRIQWHDDQSVSLSNDGKRWEYLLKSFFVSCRPDEKINLEPRITVEQGELVLGFLDETADQWVHQWTFAPGAHEPTLSVDAAGNSRLKTVLYAKTDEPLKARIEWGDGIETPPKFLSGDAGARAPAATNEAQTGTIPAAGKRLSRALGHLIFGKVRYACQKPWTDIANFTVDGRMDVCCIATGDSQKRYELGDFTTQNLQEIWNGDRMREFRRTVNGKEPLPPCARCPVLYAYQGPFFDSAAVIGAIRSRLLLDTSNPLSRPLERIIVTPIRWFLEGTVFRGFKR